MTERALAATPPAELASPALPPFRAGADVFLSTLAVKAERTRALYGHALGEFFAWLERRGIEGVNAIRPIDLVDYRNEWAKLEGRGEYKVSTIANRPGARACR